MHLKSWLSATIVFFHMFFYDIVSVSGYSAMNIEEQINLKFLIRLRKTSPQVLELLQQEYEDNTMSCSHVFEWQKRFKMRK